MNTFDKKDFKFIAQQLRLLALQCPNIEHVEPRAEHFKANFDGFKVSCLNTQEAILAMSAKFAKAKMKTAFKPKAWAMPRRQSHEALAKKYADDPEVLYALEQVFNPPKEALAA